MAKLISVAVGVVLMSTALLPTTSLAGAHVDVEADSVEYSELDGKTIFRGNVIAKRAADIITADEMTVTSSGKNAGGEATTEFVDAKGHVKITTKGAKITGGVCRFNVVDNTLEVTGDVTLTQGSSTARGQKLNIDLKTFRVKMQGGRVSGSFVPN